MNPRQAEARIIELTDDVRAVKATAVKHGENLKTHTDDIAGIQNWQKHVDMDLDTLTERIDARTEALQTQIDGCQTKRPRFDALAYVTLGAVWVAIAIGAFAFVKDWLLQ